AARDEFLLARGLAVSAFGADHFRVAEADVDLGWAAVARRDAAATRGDPAEAGRQAAEARARFASARDTFRDKLGANHPRTAEALAYLARAAADGGRPDEAR